jgi:hypothetical protein
MAKLVQLIQTDDVRGSGVHHDPVRRVTQWFTPDGQLVVESDPHIAHTANDVLQQIPDDSDIATGTALVLKGDDLRVLRDLLRAAVSQ